MNALLAGLVVLVIGDSHMVTSDYLITTLHDDLIEQGATVNSYGMCGDQRRRLGLPDHGVVRQGRTPRQGGPMIDRKPRVRRPGRSTTLIAKHHPNLVVIEMGDTMAGYGQADFPRAWIYQQVHALTRRHRGAQHACVWVGPPWGNEGSSYHKTFDRVKEMSRVSGDRGRAVPLYRLDPILQAGRMADDRRPAPDRERVSQLGQGYRRSRSTAWSARAKSGNRRAG